MSKSLLFLTFAEVIEIHQYQIEHSGGEPGIRDLNMLRSALAMPSASFDGQYLHADIEDMAAAYLFHLVENHPFVDGNKRTGAMAAVIFLGMNGYLFEASDKELVNMVLLTASGKASKKELAVFFRNHSRKKRR